MTISPNANVAVSRVSSPQSRSVVRSRQVAFPASAPSREVVSRVSSATRATASNSFFTALAVLSRISMTGRRSSGLIFSFVRHSRSSGCCLFRRTCRPPRVRGAPQAVVPQICWQNRFIAACHSSLLSSVR
ncbi:hypothetical protein [Streptomyces cacaoi]|uniref:hypothetical protein n=1 Tax=Streptomyces cacaoi TaxID=1898 RepID=UPI0011F3D1A7|nr:hypothetical protein [Streptomyces cacaoi]